MKCAIYMRVSTERQREKYSLPAQKKTLIEYAKRQGWDYTLYDEGAGSGESIEHRPRMYQLLDDAKKRKFDICLVIEMERLSRSEDLFDWLTLKKVFRENNIKIATPNQLFNLTDDEDDFLSDLFGALSKREKKKFLKRAKRGAIEAAKQGVYIGNHFRLGYRYIKETKRLEIVPEEARVIKLIFKLCNKDNLGTVAIGEHLKAKGISTKMEFAKKKGVSKKIGISKNLRIGEWTGSSVYRILTNSTYYGEYFFNRAEHKNKRKVRTRPKGEWVKVKVPSIITKAEFNLAQEKLKDRAKWADRNIKNQYLLSGLIYCAYCGSKLQGVTCKAYEKRDGAGKLIKTKKGNLLKRWKTNSYYKCYGRSRRSGRNCKMPFIKVQALDKIVWEEIANRVKQPQKLIDEEIERKRFELEKQKDSLPAILSQLEKELNKIKIAEDRMLDAYAMGKVEIDQLDKEMKVLKDRKGLVETEIEGLRLQIGDKEAREEKLRGISEYLQYVKGAIDYFDWEDRRQFLRRCIYKITIGLDGGITIAGAFDLRTADERHKLVSPEAGPGGLCPSGEGGFSDQPGH